MRLPVLPVLPVAVSAGATGGRRRPLGVVTRLVLSFTFATVALVRVISALGLPDDLLRNVAIAVLAGFGVALLVPRISDRVEAALSGLGRRRSASTTGDGFTSGAVLRSSLGLAYAPSAAPILAGVITVSAAQDFTVGRLAVALPHRRAPAPHDVLRRLHLAIADASASASSGRSSWYLPAVGARIWTQLIYP